MLPGHDLQPPPPAARNISYCSASFAVVRLCSVLHPPILKMREGTSWQQGEEPALS